MHVSIYKGRKRPDTYLFLPVKDDFSGLSDDLMRAMGELEHVMDLVLTPQRRLARADARQVMHAVLHRGCYVQMPPQDEKLPLAPSRTQTEH